VRLFPLCIAGWSAVLWALPLARALAGAGPPARPTLVDDLRDKTNWEEEMKVALLAALATVLVVPLAYADNVTATVRGVDTGQHRIGLDNGKVYAADPDVLLNKIKPGDKVTVSFSAPDAGLAASGIAGIVSQITMAK
jgi:hypothetical protein